MVTTAFLNEFVFSLHVLDGVYICVLLLVSHVSRCVPTTAVGRKRDEQHRVQSLLRWMHGVWACSKNDGCHKQTHAQLNTAFNQTSGSGAYGKRVKITQLQQNVHALHISWLIQKVGFLSAFPSTPKTNYYSCWFYQKIRKCSLHFKIRFLYGHQPEIHHDYFHSFCGN